ncbi:MAG: hypothetical protein HY304_04690 [candidate division Zixibacteria bacterium]|nr:hypothetical protein [candidate division Zixibacteria bacterium]
MTPSAPTSDLPAVTHADKIYSIGEITVLIKGVLEETIAQVWVEGEISNYKHHTLRHVEGDRPTARFRPL